MPKPFDAASKVLIETSPEAWIRLAGYEPQGKVEVVSADLSAVTSAADYAIEVQDPGETWIAHIEFVSNFQRDLPRDLVIRNALLRKRSGCPVLTIVILLHPNAYRPELSGLDESWIRGHRISALEYRVVKIYDIAVETLLNGPAGIAPMAVLSREVRARNDVPPLLERLHGRLVKQLPNDLGAVKNLWITAELYLGLKFKGPEHKAWIKALTRGVLTVKDSIIYQDIFEEGEAAGLGKGRVEGCMKILLRLGAKRWGKPNPGEKVALEAIADLDRLDRMFDCMIESPGDVASWDDLLRIQ